MYRVEINRINDSIFKGLKYAEVYPDWSTLSNDPISVLYALTWNGLNRKVNRWLERHSYDIFM